MKKLITVLLAPLLLYSCSTEDEIPAIDGLYKSDGSAHIIYVRVCAGKASSITIDDGSQQYIWEDLRTSGSYPDYTYSREGFTAGFHYVEAGATAVLDGVLTYGQTDGPNLNTISYAFNKCTANFQQINHNIK